MATPAVRGVSGVAASKRRCGRSKESRDEVNNTLSTNSDFSNNFLFKTPRKTGSPRVAQFFKNNALQETVIRKGLNLNCCVGVVS